MESISKLHVALIAFYVINLMFLADYIPEVYQQNYKYFSAVFGALLIAASLYFLLVDKQTRRIKPYHKLVSTDSSSNYLQIWFLLFITDLDSIGTFGPIFYIVVTFSLLVFCVWVVAKDAISNRSLVSGVILGHCLLGYLMFIYSKATYTRNYGEEVIGSFFEKTEYKAKYMVKIYMRDNKEEAYLLPAQLYVYSEDYEYDDGESVEVSTQRFIKAEKIYFYNGGYLNFNDCDLKDGKNYCVDQNKIGWYVELTSKKIE